MTQGTLGPPDLFEERQETRDGRHREFPSHLGDKLVRGNRRLVSLSNAT